MKLYSHQLKTVLDFLEEKTKKDCPRCNKRDFEIAPHEAALVVGGVPGFDLLSEVLPVVIVHCKHCGAIFFHSSQTVGLRKKEKP